MLQYKNIGDILASWRSSVDPLDMELIVACGIGKSREFVLAHPEYTPTEEQIETITAFAHRRIQHEPLAYILGRREFFGLDFKVTKDTLIPRPETELIVEEVIRIVEQKKDASRNIGIIDIGTGSGCIIISVAKTLLQKNPKIRHDFFGIDLSAQALEIAKENSLEHRLEKEISFMRSDLLEEASEKILRAKNDTWIIAANLPYLSEEIYRSSRPSVRNFEPREALVSDESGLMHYRRLLEQLQKILRENPAIETTLLLEISPEQSPLMEDLVLNCLQGVSVSILPDLTGRPRLVIVQTH